MFKSSVVFILFTLLCTHFTFAASVFAPLFNNIKSGEFGCSAIQQNDVLDHISSRGDSAELYSQFKYSHTGLGIYMEYLFRKGVQHFTKKQTCLPKIKEKLFGNPDVFSSYRSFLLVSWLNHRKTKLIFKKCQMVDSAFSNWVSSGWSHKNMSHESYITEVALRSQQPAEVVALCWNKNFRKNLALFQEILPLRVPYFSGLEFFKILDHNQDILIRRDSGSKVDDNFVDRMDINAASDLVRLNPEKKSLLDRLIKDQVETYVQNQQIEKLRSVSLTKKTELLDMTLMSRFLEDGTLAAVIAASSDANAPKTNTKFVETAVRCSLNQIEPNLLGGILDFTVAILFSRTLLNPFQFYKKLSAAKSIALTSVVASTPWIAEACFRPGRGDDVLVGNPNENALAIKSSLLPQDISAFGYSIEDELSQDLACSDTLFSQNAFKKSSQLSCVEETILSVLPGSLGFGFAMLSFI